MSNPRRSCPLWPLAITFTLVAACGSSSSDDSSSTHTLTAGSHKCTQDQSTEKLTCPDTPKADHCQAGQTAQWDLGLNPRTGSNGTIGDGVIWGICVACMTSSQGGQEFDCVSITCDSDATCPFDSHCKDGVCE
jgi:hypothetical protein